MVFGWGKKKAKEVKQDLPAQSEIHLSEVKKIAKDLLDLRNNQTMSEIKSIRIQILPLFKTLSNIAHNLEKDDLNVDDIDKHLRIIVVRGKKQVIDVIKKESGDLNEISSFSDAMDLSNVLNQKLKKIGDVLGRQTRVIHIFAKKYAEELKNILSDMNSFNKEVQNLTNNFQETSHTYEEIISSLDQIKKIRDNSSEKTKRISEFKKMQKLSQEKIISLESTIKNIKSGADYNEFLKLKKTLASLDDVKHQIKDEIAFHFTKISRPLGRYEYVSSLEKDQKLLLSSLVNDPFDVLTSSNKDSIIIILENVRKGISSGSISVKDVDKTMTHLTEIEEILDNLISKVHDFLEKKKKIQDACERFNYKELSGFEDQLEKLFEEKNDADKKISLFKKDISENSEYIPKTINHIEKLLRKFSKTDYTIVESSEIN